MRLISARQEAHPPGIACSWLFKSIGVAGMQMGFARFLQRQKMLRSGINGTLLRIEGFGSGLPDGLGSATLPRRFVFTGLLLLECRKSDSRIASPPYAAPAPSFTWIHAFAGMTVWVVFTSVSMRSVAHWRLVMKVYPEVGDAAF